MSYKTIFLIALSAVLVIGGGLAVWLFGVDRLPFFASTNIDTEIAAYEMDTPVESNEQVSVINNDLFAEVLLQSETNIEPFDLLTIIYDSIISDLLTDIDEETWEVSLAIIYVSMLRREEMLENSRSINNTLREMYEHIMQSRAEMEEWELEALEEEMEVVLDIVSQSTLDIDSIYHVSDVANTVGTQLLEMVTNINDMDSDSFAYELHNATLGMQELLALVTTDDGRSDIYENVNTQQIFMWFYRTGTVSNLR